ncbi:hypothetical protein HDU91_005985, partial [Kappamyces sp. JEL0680]
MSVRKKAFIALHQLTNQGSDAGLTKEKNQSILVKRKVLKFLVRSLKTVQDETTNRYAVACIHHLVSGHDRRKVKICGYGVVEQLVRILLEQPQRYSDLKYWSIVLIHQLTSTEAVTNYLIENRVIFLLVDLAKLTFGNAILQKTIFHAIVRILSSLDDQFAKSTLEELGDQKLISLASSSLRSKDSELCQWSIFLLHEFAIRRVRIDEIIGIKGLIKILVPFIQNNETIMPRIILRTLKTLCDYQKWFYRDVLKADLIPKIIKCLEVAEEQTQYWSIALLHILLSRMKSHREFFRWQGVPAILKLQGCNLIHLRLYLVDTISILGSDPANIAELEKYPQIMTTLVTYLQEQELDLKHSTLSFLVNLLAISSKALVANEGVFAEQFLEQDGLALLSKMYLDPQAAQELRTMACKALSFPDLRIQLLVSALIPGFHLLFQDISEAIKIFSADEDTESPQSPYKAFSATSASPVSKPPYTVVSPQAPSRESFPRLPKLRETPIKMCVRVATSLECIEALLTPSMVAAINQDSALLDYLTDLFQDIGTALLNALVFPLHDTVASEEDGSDLKPFTEQVARHGLYCIHSMLKIEPIRSFLHSENIVSLLNQLLTLPSVSLQKQVVVTYRLLLLN